MEKSIHLKKSLDDSNIITSDPKFLNIKPNSTATKPQPINNTFLGIYSIDSIVSLLNNKILSIFTSFFLIIKGLGIEPVDIINFLKYILLFFTKMYFLFLKIHFFV